MSRRHPQHTSRAPTRAVHLLPAARQPLAPAPLGSRAAVPKSAAALRPEGRQERRVLPAPADGIWLPIELWTHIFSYLEVGLFLGYVYLFPEHNFFLDA